MSRTIPYRWICNACGQGNAAGVAKCVKCNAGAVVGSADVEEADWRAAINDNDPAGLQEEWPVHIRWIDGAAILITLFTLGVLDHSGYSLRWTAGLLLAGLLAVAGEVAKQIEHRERVRRYIAVLDAEEERAIRRGEKFASTPEQLTVLSGARRSRLRGGPVLALLTGVIAWALLFEAPTGYFTAAGVVSAGACALLCWTMWGKRGRKSQGAGSREAAAVKARRRK